MIHLKFLPARYGDCIWIEYGDVLETNRILIDGGTSGTRHEIKDLIMALPEGERKFELLVVTHIDRDHIEGILGLLEEDTLGFEVREFWFNGYKHLPVEQDEAFGAVQGERLSVEVLKHNIPWNSEFSGNTIVVDGDELPKKELPGGMVLTLLSPAPAHLEELKHKWTEEVTAANLIPGSMTASEEVEDEEEGFGGVDIPDVEALILKEFHEDTAAGNGSSIAFLAEFDGKSMLFCGDAFPSQLLEALNTMSPNDQVDLDLMKVSHHASAHNTSPELLEKIKCKNFVVSTNGSLFKHPKPETIARIINASAPGAHLIFNYRSSFNEIWDLASLKNEHSYETTYPKDGEQGIEMEL